MMTRYTRYRRSLFVWQNTAWAFLFLSPQVTFTTYDRIYVIFSFESSLKSLCENHGHVRWADNHGYKRTLRKMQAESNVFELTDGCLRDQGQKKILLEEYCMTLHWCFVLHLHLATSVSKQNKTYLFVVEAKFDWSSNFWHKQGDACWNPRTFLRMSVILLLFITLSSRIIL